MKVLFLSSILILFLASCETPIDGGLSAIPSQDDNSGQGDTPPGDDGNSEIPGDPTNPDDPVIVPITDEFSFLKSEVFWQRVEEITPIPSTKSCSNVSSYAYLGIARLVGQYIKDFDLPMFPFGQVDYLYYRFPDHTPPSTPTDYEIFGQEETFYKLESVQSFLSEFSENPLTITGITKASEHDHDLHCRHRGGNTFDMRPFPATQPMTWRDKVYDRATNLEFIKRMLSDLEVSVIFFNDPEILNDADVQQIVSDRAEVGYPVVFRSVSGHDNHIHIEFEFAENTKRVTDYVFSKTKFSQLSIFAVDEYEKH
ncbi:MAG: hypothetical protein VX583_14115 [Bdellovibrionota bacterium]|nr:hypothetical protein [Pseudobdellovibrionaceae bacterium]